MHDAGLVRVDDPHLAARQLAALLSLADPTAPDATRDRADVRRVVAAGVRLFLDGCRART